MMMSVGLLTTALGAFGSLFKRYHPFLSFGPSTVRVFSVDICTAFCELRTRNPMFLDSYVSTELFEYFSRGYKWS